MNKQTYEEKIRLEKFIQLAGEVKIWFKDRDIDCGYTDTYAGQFAIFIQEKIDEALASQREEIVKKLKWYSNGVSPDELKILIKSLEDNK